MESGPRREKRLSFFLILILAGLAAGIIIAGYSYYRNYAKNYWTAVEQQLAAISDLKVGELAQWRKERLGDAAVFYGNTAFSALVRRYFEKPNDSEASGQLRSWLQQFQEHLLYDRVFLLDAQGVARMAVPDTPEPVAAHLLKEAPEIIRSGRTVFSDFHRDAPDRPIHLSVLVPILGGGTDRRGVGILVLRIDPRTYLYPLISLWPAPSRTAETLLVRREGNDVLYLNELKHEKNIALNLRIPLDKIEEPAVKAVLGQEGVVEGKDYRGVPVLADLRAIPDSPWFLEDRIDKAEVYVSLRERLWVTVILVGALLLGASTAVGFMWRQQRIRFSEKRLKAEVALARSEALFRTLVETMNDGLAIQDAAGLLTYVNPPLCELLGYSKEEIVGKPWKGLFDPDGLRILAEQMAKRRAGQPGTYEIPWRTKDGRIIHTLISGNPLHDSSGNLTGSFGIITDITERKWAEQALRIQSRITDIFLMLSDDEMFNEVLKIVLELMQSPFGVFGYIDEDGALVVPTMTRQIWDRCQVPEKTFTFPRNTWSDSSWPRAIREKRLVYSNKISTQIPEGHVDIQRHISLPILFQGEVIGLLQVANKETDYTEADIRSLESIAGQVAPILSARLRRNRAERTLRESEEKFRSFFELSADLVCMADIDGYFRQVNASFQRVLGYSEEEILGKPFMSFVHPDDRDKTTQIIVEKLQRGETVLSFENRYRHKDGRIVWLEWTSQPLAAKGITFAIARDITERKRAEEGLKRALADLERSNKELEQFAYVASHDLQEPLRMVASYTQLLAERYEGRLDDKAKKYIDYAVDGAVRMQRLINDLLTYSRVGTRGKPLEPTDAHSALGEAIKNLAATIEENRAIITNDELPTVRADASQLVQVFQNLIANAIKFRRKDIPRVHVSAQDHGREWVFSIQDKGIGIDPQYADRVFLIFQRLHTRKEYPGTGIGLAVCKRIVERHGGKIWFESEPGKGSTFFFAIQK